MQQTNKIRLKGTIIHMEVSRKRIMYTIATNVGINHAQPDVALIVKDNVKKEDIKFVPGDRVKISAHVQYSKQENNEETEYLKLWLSMKWRQRILQNRTYLISMR